MPKRATRGIKFAGWPRASECDAGRLGAAPELRSGEGVLVSGGAVEGGDGDVEQAQAHAELVAMLVAMAESDVAQEAGARCGQEFPIAGEQVPL